MDRLVLPFWGWGRRGRRVSRPGDPHHAPIPPSGKMDSLFKKDGFRICVGIGVVHFAVAGLDHWHCFEQQGLCPRQCSTFEVEAIARKSYPSPQLCSPLYDHLAFPSWTPSFQGSLLSSILFLQESCHLRCRGPLHRGCLTEK